MASSWALPKGVANSELNDLKHTSTSKKVCIDGTQDIGHTDEYERKAVDEENASVSVKQRSSKRSLRLSVFRKKVDSEKKVKNNARRTSSLGLPKSKDDGAIVSKPAHPVKGRFCCSFRQGKSSKKPILSELKNPITSQTSCSILTPEYGAIGGINAKSPKELIESSIMHSDNAIEQHLLSAVQPSSLPTRRKLFCLKYLVNR